MLEPPWKKRTGSGVILEVLGVAGAVAAAEMLGGWVGVISIICWW